MSMHFAPQWNKPIKPAGHSLTPTSDLPPALSSKAAQRLQPVNTGNSGHSSQQNHSQNSTSTTPFPALSQSTSATTPGAPSPNPVLSYSRATHTPVSPNFPHESGYFPSDANGHADHNSHPFRYSRETMLALWDESKVREIPIELSGMSDGKDVLLSKCLIKPIGLRELSDVEKKLLSTTIHPPAPTRRSANSSNADPAAPVPASRRQQGAQTKETTIPNGRSGPAAGFGKGEGGAFGNNSVKMGSIGASVPPPQREADGKPPGSLGGGFGGVGKRMGRRTESGDQGSWRPTRTTSGSFEGVLGFGSASTINPQPPTSDSASPATPTAASAFDATEHSANPNQSANQSTLKEREQNKEKESEPTYGIGGGPGWGTGQKKWRIAAGLQAPENMKTLEVPTMPERTESVVAEPPETPLQEREAAISQIPTPQPPTGVAEPSAPPPSLQQPKQDLGTVNWFYRDPEGQEQGPFAGSQMHEWYSHSYFSDDLPLRRSHESSFHSLAGLKAITGNSVQPFLSQPREPALPPNLPIPFTNQPPPPINGMTESFRDIELTSPAAPSNEHQRVSPNPPYNPQQPFMRDRSPLGHIPRPPSPQYHIPSPSAGPWGSVGIPGPGPIGPQGPSRISSFGSVGMPSPVGAANFASPQWSHRPQQDQIYSPQRPEMFSPSAGVGGIPPSPWAIPQPQPQPQPVPWQLPPQPAYNAPPVTTAPIPQAPQGSEADYEVEVAAEELHVPSIEDEAEPLDEPAEALEAESSTTQDPLDIDDEQVTSPPPPPVSVWGQIPIETIKSPVVPSTRESSTASYDPTPTSAAAPTSATSTSSRLPPAPASLPAKPVTANVPEKASAPSQPTDRSSLPSRPAPWADKEGSRPSGLSLREIQDAEAKEAEAKRAARPAPPPTTATSDEKPQSMSWGLPTSQKNSAPVPTTTSPAPPPAWGSGDNGPKKTLKQIQEEEEKRKAKVAQVSQAARAAGTNGAAQASTRRGYADLAATSQPAQSPSAGWTTVGAAGKSGSTATTPAPRPASIPAKPVSSIPAKPMTTVTTPAKSKANGTIDESAGPSVDFIRWTKSALTGLTVNVDEFIQLLLTFPIDPPASSRTEVRDTISDSVYANSSTLDGRRFADEFLVRRKADASRPKGVTGAINGIVKSASSGSGSLADVVKSVPKKSEDAGFRVVKAKGKKKTG